MQDLDGKIDSCQHGHNEVIFLLCSFNLILIVKIFEFCKGRKLCEIINNRGWEVNVLPGRPRISKLREQMRCLTDTPLCIVGFPPRLVNLNIRLETREIGIVK